MNSCFFSPQKNFSDIQYVRVGKYFLFTHLSISVIEVFIKKFNSFSFMFFVPALRT